MGTPTRLPNGINNREKSEFPYCMMPVFDPTKYIVYYNDFLTYNSGDFTITKTGAGGTAALTNEQGGVLLITNDAADNDAQFFQLKGEPFKFVAGKQTWFKARFKISDITQSDFVMGLQITDTTPLAVSDGVYFKKDDGSSSIDCVVMKDGTSTSSSVAVATTGLAADTYIILGFWYNGIDKVAFYVDNTRIADLAVTNLPDDEELTVSFGIQNGEAVAKTMSVDYPLVVQER